MEQIKHKLGDLVYVISDPDGNEERFVITYGIVVSISHSMDESDYDRFPTEDKEKYEGDYINYGVLTSSQEVLKVFYCDVFPTVQDALVEMSKRLEWSKTDFEHTFKLKNTNENL